MVLFITVCCTRWFKTSPKVKITRSFLAYDEAGKRVIQFQAYLSEVFLCSPQLQMAGQIGFQFFRPSHLHSTVLQVDQPLRDKPFKTAFGSSEKPSKRSRQNIPNEFLQNSLQCLKDGMVLFRLFNFRF